MRSKSWEILGSLIEVKVPDTFSFVFDSCFNELDRIDKKYSRFRDDSLLSKINQNLGKYVEVDDEFIFLLDRSLEFWYKTEGNFDISLKSALDNIGYDKDYSFKEKKLVDRPQDLGKSISINNPKKQARLNCEIEFGGFGKGFALDQISKILDKQNVKNYYINAGGDIFAKSEDEIKPWPILLEHPDDSTSAIGCIKINNCAIAASAPNRRRWGVNHHLLNAKTRRPSKGVKAIFVLAATGIEADAYSTAIFTAGFEEGISLSTKLPVETLLISDQNKMYKSAGFDAELF